jgi:hypothetical protein
MWINLPLKIRGRAWTVLLEKTYEFGQWIRINPCETQNSLPMASTRPVNPQNIWDRNLLVLINCFPSAENQYLLGQSDFSPILSHMF